jgi:hypothetical protein
MTSRPIGFRPPAAFYALGVSLALCAAPAAVRAQAVNSRPDGPIACSDFQRGGHGSWTVLAPTTIRPQGVALSLSPGQTFAPNQIYDGFEVTAILDRNCGNE